MRFFNLRIITNKEYSDLVSKAEGYEEMAAKAEKVTVEFDRKVKVYKDNVRVVENTANRLSEENLKMGKDLSENAKKIEELTAQNKKMIASVKDYSAKNKKVQDMLDRSEKFISELKSKNASLSSENKALKTDLSEKELVIKNLSDALAKYTANPEETKGDEIKEADEGIVVEATEENWGEGSIFGQADGEAPKEPGAVEQKFNLGDEYHVADGIHLEQNPDGDYVVPENDATAEEEEEEEGTGEALEDEAAPEGGAPETGDGQASSPVEHRPNSKKKKFKRSRK